MACIPTFSLRSLLPSCISSFFIIQPDSPPVRGTHEEQRAEGKITEALSTYSPPIFHGSIRRSKCISPMCSPSYMLSTFFFRYYQSARSQPIGSIFEKRYHYSSTPLLSSNSPSNPRKVIHEARPAQVATSWLFQSHSAL